MKAQTILLAVGLLLGPALPSPVQGQDKPKAPAEMALAPVPDGTGGAGNAGTGQTGQNGRAPKEEGIALTVSGRLLVNPSAAAVLGKEAREEAKRREEAAAKAKREDNKFGLYGKTIDALKECKWVLFALLLLVVGRRFWSRAGEYVLEVYLKQGRGFKIFGSYGLEFPSPTALSDTLPSAVSATQLAPAAVGAPMNALGADIGGVAPAAAELPERWDYPPQITESAYLVHAAKVVRPRTDEGNGWYHIAVSVEFDPPSLAEKVRSVSYRLHSSFKSFVPNGMIACSDARKNFMVWLSAYGEFVIIARLEYKDGTQQYLSRYLDLPGRPPE